MAEVKVANSTKVEKQNRPAYETPKIQVMSEREILNTFQIVQAVTSWWTSC
jgi:hypothetical protein